MRILVTGGAGFIGSALCRHLILEQGWQVVCVDKLTYAGHLSSLAAISAHPDFAFVRADICDSAAMASIFAAHGPDAVMHLAAESHVDRSIDNPPQFVSTNIVGTAVLLDAALSYWKDLPKAKRDGFRFHHISTDEIYGSVLDGRSGESSLLDPRSPYAASKAAADHLVSAWHHTFGLPSVISNCSNNFGPYQLPEKLIPLVILNALESRSIPVFGDGLHVRDWLYVDDHVRALVGVLTKGTIGQRYNIGARNERTNLSVVELICDLVDRYAGADSRRRHVKFVADRPGHDRRYAVDPSKIERDLGWRPRATFEDALETTVRWYLDNAAWWKPLRAAGNGTIRLGTRINPERSSFA